MINGAHAIVYSTDSDADRAFFRDILGLPHVDVGEGWLIFGLPPAEVAVHSTDAGDADADAAHGHENGNGRHEVYFMCDDVEQLRERLSASNVESSEVSDEGWGLVTQVTLPGGSKLGIYQPRHARPAPFTNTNTNTRARTGRAKAKKPTKAKAKKAPAKAKPAAAKAPKAKKSAKKKTSKRKAA